MSPKRSFASIELGDWQFARAVDLEITGGRCVGIGVVLETGRVKRHGRYRRCVRVAAVHSESPAAKVGITAGDVIVAIDGATTIGMRVEDGTMRLRGAAGDQHRLLVERPGANGSPSSREVTTPIAPFHIDSAWHKLLRRRGIDPAVVDDAFREFHGSDDKDRITLTEWLYFCHLLAFDPWSFREIFSTWRSRYVHPRGQHRPGVNIAKRIQAVSDHAVTLRDWTNSEADPSALGPVVRRVLQKLERPGRPALKKHSAGKMLTDEEDRAVFDWWTFERALGMPPSYDLKKIVDLLSPLKRAVDQAQKELLRFEKSEKRRLLNVADPLVALMLASRLLEHVLVREEGDESEYKRIIAILFRNDVSRRDTKIVLEEMGYPTHQCIDSRIYKEVSLIRKAMRTDPPRAEREIFGRRQTKMRPLRGKKRVHRK
jgi:hypothetical protein